MENNLSELIVPLLRRYWLVVILACGGLIFFLYGLITFLGSSTTPNEVNFEANLKEPAQISQNLIAVDIEGEVVHPGVYKLKQSSLIQDGLIASGGFTSLADRDWIAKNINLALKISDGQKIYIPKLGETINSASNVLSTSDLKPGLININTASEGELNSLPAVGSVTSAKIIDNRPYSAINDLLDKSVITSHVFDQIKDKIIAP